MSDIQKFSERIGDVEEEEAIKVGVDARVATFCSAGTLASLHTGFFLEKAG